MAKELLDGEPSDNSSFKWIDTDGGPLILVSETDLGSWEGAYLPSGGRTVEATFRYGNPAAEATDYDRACDINDYLGLILVGQGWGLVVNDAPEPTAWLPDRDRKGGFLIRRMPDDEQVLRDTMDDIPADIWGLCEIEILLNSTRHYLFDSAYAGFEANQIENCLLIELSPGKYNISTGIFRPDKYITVLLHRFTLHHQYYTHLELEAC